MKNQYFDGVVYCKHMNSKHISCCFRVDFNKCTALKNCNFEDGICRFYKTTVDAMPVYMRGAKND